MHNSYNFLSKLDLDSQVETKLSNLLTQIEKGSATVLRSPLGDALDAETILSLWDSIFNSNSGVITSDLKFVENSNRDKFGPRSISVPWVSREENLFNSFADEKNISKSIVDAIETPTSHALRPLTLLKAAEFLKRGTNSGLPYLTRKGEVLDIYRGGFDPLYRRQDPCVLFTRTQEGLKTRDVWGYPMADTLDELRFYRPLLNYQKKLNWRNALSGPESVDIKLTSLLKLSKAQNRTNLSIDFSNYDESVKITLQQCSFQYIKGLFQLKYSHDIDRIAHRFNTIGIVTPNGIMEGRHGVPSGSTFTNEVDSIAQYLAAISYPLTSEYFDIQGDDGAYSVKDPESLKSHFRKFWLAVNGNKSFMSPISFVYLQNLYSLDYEEDGIVRGIYPTYRALNRILFPERFDKFSEYGIRGTDYYSIRTICILENCRNHPLFSEFVKFVYQLDKTGLQYSNQGLINYIKRINKTSGVADIFNYRYEDKVKGINSFETVKLISSF